MHFTKMHGLGNDYLYVFGEVPADIRELSVRLSDRHFGAGADGMIYISPSNKADFKMRIFNADGSEAKMCGNGIRCVGKYVYDKGYTDKTRLRIETLSGIRELELRLRCGKVAGVEVGMGAVCVGETMKLSAAGQDSEVPLTTLGPAIEHHEAFPGGVNVEFVQKLGPRQLRMRVWERGSGVTMACGTGACASAAAAVAKGICAPEEPIHVHLDGGILEIRVAKDGSVSMTGPAKTVYEGETEQ